MKCNYFDKEQRKKPNEKSPFKADNLYYQSDEDFYVCLMGQRMKNMRSFKQKTKTGFIQTIPNTVRLTAMLVRCEEHVTNQKATGEYRLIMH